MKLQNLERKQIFQKNINYKLNTQENGKEK